ncbi:MAG TPA: hypothetical protein PKB04_03070, partial [Phenylobacterium sp.]|nr:hypothetical protein [Phenylobacterium sp.]
GEGARRDLVPAALRAIGAHEGAGVAVFIRDSDASWLSARYGHEGGAPAANILRDYGVGAQILLDLGVRDLELLSNSDTVLPGSAGYGLRILGRRALGEGLRQRLFCAIGLSRSRGMGGLERGL